MQDQEKDFEEYSPMILTLEDENGENHQFEIVDEVDFNEQKYIAVIPFYEDPEQAQEEEPVLIIFRVGDTDEDGFDTFDIVDDDEEYLEVGAVFTKRLEEMYDIEE